MLKKTFLLFFILSVVLPSCRTYYQRQQEFNRYFTSGRLEEALNTLDSDRKAKKKRTRLIYVLNKGTLHHLLGNYTKSNEYFEEAYILGEDYLKDYMNEALALITNPNVTEYKGEDFELLMIHYYKAMNFIQLGNYDAALVECRRMNNKLNVLNDRFTSNKRYRRDAFINNLMGILYEASGDHNNAFIAYRNAYNIYSEDYAELFGVNVPEQLKTDLLRAAYNIGFHDQVRFYESKFDITYRHQLSPDNGDLVLFWKNGLGPVKDEWSLNFHAVKGQGGEVIFVNEELGLSFPFHVPPGQKSSGNIGDLRIVRVAFPKYVERKQVYANARLRFSNDSHPLHLAQNINAIAFKSLEDRMLRELGSALLRLAVRQTTEALVRRQNNELGALLGIFGAATERADTRHWQTLPYSVHYARVSLPEGKHSFNLDLILPNGNTARSVPLSVDITARSTSFLNIHTLDAKPPGIR